ncbi:MAG: hypothetical protein ACI8Z7_000631 [Candidatus Nanohaloarchaea archaeon]|jgi:hypothetical protein
MVLEGLFAIGGDGLLQQIFMVVQILSFLILPALLVFFPRIMIWQADRKLENALVDLEAYRNDTEVMFLDKFSSDIEDGTRDKFESLRDFKFSAPTGIDPAGMVGKLENVLDSSEDKFKRFVEGNADTEDEEELADLNMAFKGVMGTHQIFKVMRHFRQLIKKTQMIYLVQMVTMMVPIYKELAESQKEATRAFIDQAPIGDTIGPLVAAKLIESDEEELEEVAENLIHSEEEIDDSKVHVIKSSGPGARLGKYGDALEKVTEENDLEAIITVDAGAKFEGEETGSISEGVGVMMGGPGVEKSKIEDVAVEHDLPLEGIIIKQSPPEASKPMKKEIYEAYKPAVAKVEEIVKEFDGEVAVVGVGNTCGAGNTREEVAGVHNRLRKYWKEYEEQEEEEVSYMGVMGAMPSGGEQAELLQARDNLIWNMIR